jgi:CheY-like chemotaxis protein
MDGIPPRQKGDTMHTDPHILVVDDHDAFRNLVVLRLRLLGCSCVAVDSVSGAVDALERERFDTILSDFDMPGPNGLDLLAFASRRCPDVPFVLMSSFVEDALRNDALAAGAAAVHEKSELVDSFSPVVPARSFAALSTAA